MFNYINNIDFDLDIDDIIKIKSIFNKYLMFTKKNTSLKKLLPMIFKYLNIDFCIKPEYDEDFKKFLETNQNISTN